MEQGGVTMSPAPYPSTQQSAVDGAGRGRDENTSLREQSKNAQGTEPAGLTAAAAPAKARRESEQPGPPLSERYAGLTALAAGVVAGALAGIAHAVAARSIPQPSGVEEIAVGANAFGLTRLGGFQVPDSLSDQVLSVHLALYNEVTSAADRNASVSGALREFLLVIVVAGALALFTLCRQLGLSMPTALGAVLLAYVPPAVVSAQVLVYSGTVATTWLLVAAILLAARPTAVAVTWLTCALAVLLIALAAVIAPVALLLPIGVVVVAVVTGTLFPRWGVARRGLGVAAVLVVLGVAGATGFDSLDAPADPLVPDATIVALAVIGLILAAVATWRVLWIRPLAMGCVPLFAAALLPWDAQASALVIGVPIIAVLLGAVIEEALTGLRRPSPAVVRGGIAALLVAVTIGMFTLPASSTDSAPGEPQSELAAWLAGNLALETTVQVQPLLWVELVRAGVPAERLERTDTVASDLPPAVLLAERAGENTDLPLVARFGDGPLAIDVRQRVADVAAAEAALDAERVASEQFGSALAENPNLTLDDAVRDDLGSGNVDSRLLTVLATAAADFGFTIDSFPRTNGVNEAGTLRTVRISEVSDVTPAGAGAESEPIGLRDFFRFQLLLYRPLSQGFDAGVLVVVYAAPSPVGLLS